jgi:hypothetical protein
LPEGPVVRGLGGPREKVRMPDPSGPNSVPGRRRRLEKVPLQPKLVVLIAGRPSNGQLIDVPLK